MRKNILHTLTLVALFLFLCPSVRAGQELTLLIHPYLTPTEIHRKFAPLAFYLLKETGKRIVIKVSKDYQEQINAVGTNQMDFAYMGPNLYVEMTKKYGKKPLLACQEVNGHPFLHGMIFVKNSSPINSLADLAGKRLAFVSPESTMGYVIPRLMLQEAGVDLKQAAQVDFLKGHSNVALAVLNGYYDAGAVKDETFYSYQDRGLRMLAKSPPIHEHLFVGSSQLPESLISSLSKALQSLHDPDVLSAICPNLTKLLPVKDSDYNDLRNILATAKPSR
ncbi:MAG: phosphate/phosphite/phosphonate ABC transporter substrate-binding protein [Desulfobulbaceae bacterium]|nr:phosphate/phosphite/phosphonate ABC transporter substrate-binding protein [Desulfobulbaceae bacterium]